MRETYDLVVVGGGISGLAAAYYFRQTAGPDGARARARQPRRLRRPRQAQRVHAQRPHLDRLRRHAVDRQPGAVLGRRRKGLIADLGIDVAALRAGARRRAVQVARPRAAARSSTRRPSAPTSSSSARRAMPSKEFLAQTPLAAADAGADPAGCTTEKRDNMPGPVARRRRRRGWRA